MHTALSLGLLAAAAAINLGLALVCKICGGPGNSCRGSLEFCPPGKDSCGITLLEGTGALQVRSIAKTCIRSDSCNEPFASVNLGKDGEAWSHLTCCLGEEGCERITPTMPPLNVTPNGKKCPACYAAQNLMCEEEIIRCTGDQFYCLEKYGSIILGGKNVPIIIKGCANKAYCNDMHEEIHNAITANCTLASGVTRIVPESLGLLLQALAGLLLAKALV